MKKIAIIVALFLAGCAGLQTPQSLDESLGAAEAQLAGIEISAAQAVGTGMLSPKDAQELLTLGDQATAALKAARSAEGTGNLATAQQQLALASTLLAQLATYLQTHGVK